MSPSAGHRMATLTSRHYLPLQNVLSVPYDIVLVVAGRPAPTFASHRLILAAVSSVLHEVLVELSPSDQQCCLILPDVSPDAIQNMLTFVYSGGSLTLKSKGSFVQFMKLLKLLDFKQSNDIIVLGKGNDTCKKNVSAVQLHEANQVDTTDDEADYFSNDDQTYHDDDINERQTGASDYLGFLSSSEADPLAMGQTFKNAVNSNTTINSDQKPILKNIDDDDAHDNCDNDKVPSNGGASISAENDSFTQNCSFNKEVNLYKCKMCPYSSKYQRAMKIHLITHTGEKPFACGQCSDSFGRHSSLKRHMLTHTDQKPYKCDQCPKAYREVRSLRDHQFNHMGLKPFQCRTCSSSFVSQKALNKHFSVHHGGKPCKGEQFSHRFVQLSNLKKQVCAQPSQFQCDQCSVSCGKLYRLKRHMMTHTGEKPFVCEICSASFNRRCTLRLHMSTHSDSKSFQCDQCSLSFGRREYLVRHLKLHASERPFVCDQCSKSFVRSDSWKKHIATHAEPKPFQCLKCSKSFASRQELKRHMQAHDGQTPFKCKECSRTFGYEHYLKIHMLIHTGEKPFTCEICSGSFPTKGRLRRHMFTHSNQKPFKCDHCSKSFAEKAKLLKHLQTKHINNTGIVELSSSTVEDH